MIDVEAPSALLAWRGRHRAAGRTGAATRPPQIHQAPGHPADADHGRGLHQGRRGAGRAPPLRDQVGSFVPAAPITGAKSRRGHADPSCTPGARSSSRPPSARSRPNCAAEVWNRLGLPRQQHVEAAHDAAFAAVEPPRPHLLAFAMINGHHPGEQDELPVAGRPGFRDFTRHCRQRSQDLARHFARQPTEGAGRSRGVPALPPGDAG